MDKLLIPGIIFTDGSDDAAGNGPTAHNLQQFGRPQNDPLPPPVQNNGIWNANSQACMLNGTYVNQSPYYPDLTPVQLSALNYERALLATDYWHKCEIEGLKLQYREEERKREEEQRIRYEAYKALIRERQCKALDALKTARKLAQIAITEDSAGRFILEYRFPDNTVKYSTPVFSVTKMRMRTITCAERQDYLEQVLWDGGKSFLLSPVDTTPKEFQLGLKRNGVTIGMKRNIAETVFDLVLCRLKLQATEYEVPSRFGWNLMKNGAWHFAGNEERSFSDYFKMWAEGH